MSAQLAVVAGSPPEQPERDRLRNAIERVASLTKALTEASAPITRLSAITGALAAAEADLARCRAADDCRLGEWLVTGGEGARPEVSLATLEAERRVAGLARDGAAARAAMPALEASYQQAAAPIRAAQSERDAAVYAVAGEVGMFFVRTIFRQRIAELMATEAVAVGLVRALAEASPRNDGSPDDPRPLAAAALITEALYREQQAGQAVAGIDRGRRLLRALASDSEAVL
jgi:hypothetical protein